MCIFTEKNTFYENDIVVLPLLGQVTRSHSALKNGEKTSASSCMITLKKNKNQRFFDIFFFPPHNPPSSESTLRSKSILKKSNIFDFSLWCYKRQTVQFTEIALFRHLVHSVAEAETQWAKTRRKFQFQMCVWVVAWLLIITSKTKIYI